MPDVSSSDPSVQALIDEEREAAQRMSINEPSAPSTPEPSRTSSRSSSSTAMSGAEEEPAAETATPHAPLLDDEGTPIRIVDPQLKQELKDTGLYKWDDIEGDEMQVQDKLFEVFVVVGLRSKEPATFFRFDAADKPDTKTYSQLEPFCYPNVDLTPLRAMRPVRTARRPSAPSSIINWISAATAAAAAA